MFFRPEPPPHECQSFIHSFEYFVHQSKYQQVRHRENMGRIVLHHHGRLKEKSIVALYAVYEQRLKARSIKIEFHSEKLEIQDYYAHLSTLDGKKFFLDEHGEFKSSLEFAEMVKLSTLESEHIHFCIGPFDGWQGVLSKSDMKLSLSPMTLTHEFTAVLLLEQIYRAFEILRGSNYHKE